MKCVEREAPTAVCDRHRELADDLARFPGRSGAGSVRVRP